MSNKGYTKIPDEIIEALARIRIPGEATQVLWAIIRKTYGWGKPEDTISLSQFTLSTGLKKPHVSRAITKLLGLNIIIKKGNGLIPKYRINKDFDKWQPLSKKVTLPKKVKGISQKDNDSLPFWGTTRDTTQETLIQETKHMCVFFGCRAFLFDNLFWSIYPKRRGKKLSYEKSKKLFCDFEEIKDKEIVLILTAVVNYANSESVKSGVGIRDAINFLKLGVDETVPFWTKWVEEEEKPPEEAPKSVALMCKGRYEDVLDLTEDCPIREDCWRFKAEPEEEQVYLQRHGLYRNEEKSCPRFFEIKKESDKEVPIYSWFFKYFKGFMKGAADQTNV